MVQLSFAASTILALAATATALALPNPNPNPNPNPSPLSPDPAGAKNVGNGAGLQFITGACLSDADCASTCCAALDGGGICSGVDVGFAQGKQGCGFSSSSTGTGSTGTSASSAAAVAGAASVTAAAVDPVNTNEAGFQNVGNGNGLQFITGQCLADADCASGCCAASSGLCASPNIGETCGFIS
ncbi:hypothetical protein GGR56DRAFT_677394 [Xylariaceae sp. FL0804]|nr:hypothetical protein GGR56DRAFT_677394 [Xylariaceae sp. FL0804]